MVAWFFTADHVNRTLSPMNRYFWYYQWLVFPHVTTHLQYKQIRDEKRAQKLFKQDLLDDAFKPKNDMLTVPTKNIPSVADVIGKTLPMIGKYNDLGETEK